MSEEVSLDDVDEVLEDLSVLRLKPNDVLVFRSPHALSGPGRRRIKEALKRCFDHPPDKMVVLEDGVELGVVRQDGEAPS